MKTKIIIAVLAMMLSLNACASNWVELDVLVHEEDGTLIEGADVNGLFITDGINSVKRDSHSDVTSNEGMAKVAGDEEIYVDIVVSKQGYYQTIKRKVVNQEKRGLVDVLLRPMRNPIPLYAKTITLEFPQRNHDYEFDFFGGDFVSQGRGGSYADVKIRFVRNLIDSKNFTQTAILTFTSPTDGVVKLESKDAWKMSEFKTPYLAAIDGYKNQIELKNARSPEGALRENLNTPFFVRLRSEVDSDGNIKTANYCKIFPGIELFGALADKPLLGMTYYCNPNLNDRNLEFDPQKNLFKNLKAREQVRKP